MFFYTSNGVKKSLAYVRILSRIVDLEPFQEPGHVSLDAPVRTPKKRGGHQLVAQFSTFKQILLFQKMGMPQIPVTVVDERLDVFRTEMYHPQRFHELDHKPFMRQGRRV